MQPYSQGVLLLLGKRSGARAEAKKSHVIGFCLFFFPSLFFHFLTHQLNALILSNICWISSITEPFNTPGLRVFGIISQGANGLGVGLGFVVLTPFLREHARSAEGRPSIKAWRWFATFVEDNSPRYGVTPEPSGHQAERCQ